MKARFAIALFAVGVEILAGPAIAGQKEKPARAPKASAARPPQPARPQAQKGRPNAAPAQGIGNVQRLAEMSPKDRQKALASLPPERREAVMKRLQNYQQMAPAERQRAAFELQKLQSLPQPRRAQVRRSLEQFNDLPEERKTAIGSELGRLNSLPDEERRARMNSEEFRNRYSPAEQQMMSNLSEVMPRREEQ